MENINNDIYDDLSDSLYDEDMQKSSKVTYISNGKMYHGNVDLFKSNSMLSDYVCPSSFVQEDDSKNYDCSSCILNGNCTYTIKDIPVDQKKYWCNKDREVFFKENSNIAENDIPVRSVIYGVPYCDTCDLIDVKLFGEPVKSFDEKQEYLKEIEERRKQMNELESKLNEACQKHSASHKEFMDHVDVCVHDFVAKIKEDRLSKEQELHDLLHRESDLEEDRPRVR